MTANIVLLEQPKRPLSAYNYFFRAERAKMLGMEKIEERDPNEKRKHRKVHGKIGFRDMAAQIGSRWKSLSKEEREPFTKQFLDDRARYKKEMKEWNERMKQKESKKSATSAGTAAATTVSSSDVKKSPSTAKSTSAATKTKSNKISKTSCQKRDVSDIMETQSAIPLSRSVDADAASPSTESNACFMESVLSDNVTTPQLSTSEAFDAPQPQYQPFENRVAHPQLTVHDSIDISLQILENDLMGMGSATAPGANRGRKRTHVDLMSNEELDQHLTTFLMEQQETLNDDLPNSCTMDGDFKLPTTEDEGDFDEFLKAFDFSDTENEDDDVDSDLEEPTMEAMMPVPSDPFPINRHKSRVSPFSSKPPVFPMSATSRPSWMTSIASARPSFVSGTADNAAPSNATSSMFPANNNYFNQVPQRSRSSPSAVSFLGRTNSVAAAALTPQQLHQSRQMAADLERLQMSMNPAATAAQASAASLLHCRPPSSSMYNSAFTATSQLPTPAIPVTRPSSSETSSSESSCENNNQQFSATSKNASQAKTSGKKAGSLWGQALMGYEPPSPVTVTSNQLIRQQKAVVKATRHLEATAALLKQGSRACQTSDADMKGELMKSIESLQVSFRSNCHDDFGIEGNTSEHYSVSESKCVPEGRDVMEQASDFWNSNMPLLDPFDTSSSSFDCSERLLSA